MVPASSGFKNLPERRGHWCGRMGMTLDIYSPTVRLRVRDGVGIASISRVCEGVTLPLPVRPEET
jgi:hypothetical protein